MSLFMNDYIRLAALTELKCNELLVQTLLSQQPRIKSVLEKESRDNNDLKCIYTCYRAVAKILHDKKQLMKTLNKELIIDKKKIIQREIIEEDKIENGYEMKVNANVPRIESDESEDENDCKIGFNESKAECRRKCVMKRNRKMSFCVKRRKFSCLKNGCSKIFQTRKAQLLHIQTYHLWEMSNKYKCKYCDEQFYTKWDFNVHLRKHSGDKQYQCNICHRRFSEKNRLKLHSKTKHQ